VSKTHGDDVSEGSTDEDAGVAPNTDGETGVEPGTGVEPEAEAEEETGESDETVEADETGREDSHLDGVDAGCGCAEVWETLSEQRGE